MAQDTTDAQQHIEAMLAELEDWRGPRLAELRTWIHEAVPEVEEQWKWMGSPVWAHDGVIFVVGNAHKDKVKLTFAEGANLKDPKGLLNNGTGKKWRAIDLYEGDKVSKTAFKALIREAVRFSAAQQKAKAAAKAAKTAARKKS